MIIWENKMNIDTLTSLNFLSLKPAAWLQMSMNIRLRDRLVKVLQYGCQMLLGYYGNFLSDSKKNSFSSFRKTASNARKAFWILKWLNSLIEVKKIAGSSTDDKLLKNFDLAQQLCWVIYFYCENLIFLSRTKLFGINESYVEKYSNMSWFLGDFNCLAVEIKRYLNILRNIDNYEKKNGSNIYHNELCLLKYKLYKQKIAFFMVSLKLF